MSDPIRRIIDAHGVMILDGAMATELEARGCDLDDPLWSAKVLIEAPETIAAVHRAYFEAGADCATTASYQATLAGFERRGLPPAEARRLLRLSLEIALEARDGFWDEPGNRAGRSRPVVAASIGSYGAFLADGSEFRGHYGLSRKQLVEHHRAQLEVLSQGADLIAFETVPSPIEAEAIAELLETSDGPPAWVSFSCRDEHQVCEGGSLRACGETLASVPRIAAIGINCTAPRYCEPLIAELHDVSDKPIAVYPNSGEGYDADRRCWTGEGQGSAELGRRWRAAGARVLGGCCRTAPDHIRALAALREPTVGTAR